MWQRLRGPLLIVALGIVYFHDLVLHPTAILYSDHSDFIAGTIPNKMFLVRSFHDTGELPLWCPFIYGGSPFIHDIPNAAFYPPHLVLYFLPAESVGTALSWLIVAHVILAGLFMYAYAGSQKLSEPGRLIAAIGYMFAGRWLLHVLAGGHYILICMAWLPLLLLFFEAAIRKRSFSAATAAGVVLALMLLGGQQQWTFYSGIFVALWTFRTAWETAQQPATAASNRRRLYWAVIVWLGLGIWLVVVALGLFAVQLLPTMEAAALSLRSDGVDKSEVIGGGLRTLLFLVGPAVSAPEPNLMWEDRGGLSLLWLTAAVLAGITLKGRVRYQSAVTLLLVVFALGGAYLVQGLPGFRLFRSPNRIFIILGLPLSLLAGHATDALAGADVGDLFRRGRLTLVRLVIALLILTGGFTLRTMWEGKPLQFHVYWLSLLVTIPLLFALFGRWHPWLVRHRLAVWMLLLLADSWALTFPLVETRQRADLYTPSPSVVYLSTTLHPGEARVLDRDGAFNDYGSPLGRGTTLAPINQIEAVRGYSSLDNRRYKEYLQFISGKDEPLTAFGSPLAFPVILDFRMVNKNLLDLLGVRYLLTPSASPQLGSAFGAAAAAAWLPPANRGWAVEYVDADAKAYDMETGGVRPLPPYAVYRNEKAFPRTFVVYRAARLPEPKDILVRLSSTDFAKEVLLEKADGEARGDVDDATPRIAEVTEYTPNQVTITVSDGPPGYLVLADCWYPGWIARFDGEPEGQTPYRADYLFRAVRLPRGSHTIVFRFEPPLYFIGRRISLATAALVLIVFLISALRRLWRKPKA